MPRNKGKKNRRFPEWCCFNKLAYQNPLFHRSVYSAQLKSKCGNLLDTYHISISHSPLTFENISSINLVFIFGCSSSTTNPVSARRVDSSVLVFSLSSHRYSDDISVFSLTLVLLIHNKMQQIVLNTATEQYYISAIAFYTPSSCFFYIRWSNTDLALN
jgi:hypothetical protein